jgi:hypothetical protein
MKRQKSCGPRLGKLVHQLPGVVTFAYDLRFRRMIARWKGIIEEIHFGASIMPLTIIENLYLEKPSFRPSKWPWKLKPAKNSKLSKLPESYFEPVGKGGWPPISTWIINPSNKNGFIELNTTNMVKLTSIKHDLWLKVLHSKKALRDMIEENKILLMKVDT